MANGRSGKRVHTIEASDPERKKKGFHIGGVHCQAWWTFRIFFIFSARGRGSGSSRRLEGGGGSVFYRKSQEGEVSQERGAEGLGGWEAGCGEFWAGGGPKYFFEGPKCPPSKKGKPCQHKPIHPQQCQKCFKLSAASRPAPYRGSQSSISGKEGFQARKRHININFLVRLPLGRPPVCPRDKPSLSLGQTFVPGTNPGCPWDKPGFSSYFTQWKPSLSQGQTQFVPGTIR